MTETETVVWMRKNKVLVLRRPDGLEIHLAPEALVAAAKKPIIEQGPNLDEVGSTGSTRREQMELYGQVFEQDFRSKVGQ